MGLSSTLYKLIYLLHLGSVITGFGAVMVASFLDARARDLPAGDRRVLVRAVNQLGRAMVTGPVILAGVLGIVLVILSDEAFTFAQMWISIAFLLWFGVLGVWLLLVAPNAKAMEAIGAQLAGGGAAAAGSDQAAELAARGKRAAAFTGIVHLLWLALMVDMIWKPGL
jgi:hypothetical protein